MHPAARWLDRGLLAALTLSYLAFLISSVFGRRDWSDTIAYGLPGANLVVHGTLAVPQLGSQFAFDRYWLFNAPLIVLGDVPWFLAGGVGRIPFLLGVVAMGVVNLVVFTMVCRRLLNLESIAFAVLIAFAFLGTRGVAVSDLYNQKYAVVAAGCLLLAFASLGARGPAKAGHYGGPAEAGHYVRMPFGARRPAEAGRYVREGAFEGRRWWQWLAASMLPLVHIVLAPVAVVWFASAAFDWYRDAPSDAPDVASRSMTGPIVFAIGAAANLAWYGRAGPFITQLWPHITFGDFRTQGSLSGLLDTAASPIASAPTWILHGIVVAAALLTVAAAARNRRVRQAGLPAALAIVALLALDIARGYPDYGYLLIGAGPALLAGATSRGRRGFALVALTLIASANLAVASRLDRTGPDWTTTAESERFLIEHTQSGDRIVLAPPFAFTAVTAPPARDVRRIVPQPYFLEGFDSAAWLRDLNACCDVYVGREEFLLEPVIRQPRRDPFFLDAAIDRYEFRGEAVVVARKRGRPSTGVR